MRPFTWWSFLKTSFNALAWGMAFWVTACAQVRAGDVTSASAAAADALPSGAAARLGSMRFRQGSPVANLAYVLDGKAILSVGRMPPIRLFDAATGKLLRDFQFADHQDSRQHWNKPHGQPIAVSPDGRQILVGYGRRLELFDIETGKHLRSFEGPAFALHLVAFSPDGKTIAAAEVPVESDEHDKWISVMMSPQGLSKRDKLQGPKGKVQIWDARTGKSLRIIEAVDGSVASLAIAPDGRILAVGGEGYDLRLWDMEEGKELRSFRYEREANDSQGYANPEIQRIAALAFSPDGKSLVSGGGDLFPGGHQMIAMPDTPSLDVWDRATGKHVRRLLAHVYNGFAGVTFSPAGQTLAAAGRSGLHLFEMPGGKEFFSPYDSVTFQPNPAIHLSGLAGELSAVAFAGHDKTVCFGTEAGTIHCWNVKAGKEPRPLIGHIGPIHNIAFSADGRNVATSGADGTTRVWNLPDSTERKKFNSEMFAGGALAFSGDGENLLIVDSPGRWLKISDGRLLKEFKTDGDYIGHQAVASADGATVLEISTFSPLNMLHVSLGSASSQFPPVPGYHFSINPRLEHNEVEAMAISRNGKVGALASGKQNPGERPTDRRITIWDTTSEKETQHWTIDRRIIGLALAPDGRLLASCSQGQSEIHICDPRTGKETCPPIRLTSVPRSTKVPMVFSADGKLLAAGCETIEVWDIASGVRRHEFSGHRGTVNCLAFDSSNRYLASGSDDTTALIWDISRLDDHRRSSIKDAVGTRRRCGHSIDWGESCLA